MIMLSPRLNYPMAPYLSSLFDDFDQLVESLLWQAPRQPNEFVPACDVNENDEHFLISFDMPGIRLENITVEAQEGKLTVSGERQNETLGGPSRVYKKERSFGKFQKAFELPISANVNKIEAHFLDGVLSIAIPKKETVKGRKIEIQSEKSGIFNRFLGKKKEAKIVKDVHAS